jgi:zinc transporter, ZIP family
MPLSIQAGLWGLLSGSALVLGAAIAYFVSLPPRVIAAVMAFGSGVLISALSFDLMDEAYRTGGIVSTSIGFLAGAAIYTAANIIVSRRGAKHRKRSGHAPDARQQSADEGGGLAIALGALLDGIPEAIVIGVSLLSGEGVGIVAVAAVFLSNLPEGLSSAAGMRKAGRSPFYHQLPSVYRNRLNTAARARITATHVITFVAGPAYLNHSKNENSKVPVGSLSNKLDH